MSKKFKRIGSFLMAIAMILPFFGEYPSGTFDFDWGFDWSVSAEEETQTEYWIDFPAENFAGGDGTEGNPYQIATAEQLAYLAYRRNNGQGEIDSFYELDRKSVV